MAEYFGLDVWVLRLVLLRRHRRRVASFVVVNIVVAADFLVG